MTYTLDYIAAAISILINACCGAYLVKCASKIKNSTRLVSLSLTRATYCAMNCVLMGIEINYLKTDRENMKFEVYFAFCLLGLSLTSSWLLSYEYWVSSNELILQLSLKQSSVKDTCRRQCLYRGSNVLILSMIWVPILVQLIFFEPVT